MLKILFEGFGLYLYILGQYLHFYDPSKGPAYACIENTLRMHHFDQI